MELPGHSQVQRMELTTWAERPEGSFHHGEPASGEEDGALRYAIDDVQYGGDHHKDQQDSEHAVLSARTRSRDL